MTTKATRRPRFTDDEIKALSFALDYTIVVTTGAGGTVNDAVKSADKRLGRLLDKIEEEEANETE